MMPFFPADYARDTRDLSWEEDSAYRQLLELAWERDGIPNDLGLIRRMMKPAHARVFNRIVPVILKRFFYLNENGLYVNKRCEKEKKKSQNIAETRRKAAEKRWNINGRPSDLQCQSQSQSQSNKKEEDIAPANAGAAGGGKYAFESGAIRLNHRDLERWRAAYKRLDLEAELLALAPWATALPPGNWFHAVPQVLAKRNREAAIRSQQLEQKPYVWRSGMEGIV